jgi:predicted anti-sigma-YlaC factor YlaD
MKFLMIPCKKATYLLSKKEEGKLSFLEKIQLKAHLSICSFCRLFEQQTIFIGKNAKHIHNYNESVLPEQAKEKIIAALKEL